MTTRWLKNTPANFRFAAKFPKSKIYVILDNYEGARRKDGLASLFMPSTRISNNPLPLCDILWFIMVELQNHHIFLFLISHKLPLEQDRQTL
jgi:hypothetical protein